MGYLSVHSYLKYPFWVPFFTSGAIMAVASWEIPPVINDSLVGGLEHDFFLVL